MTNNINGIDVSECRFYEPKAQKMTCHEETITKPCESTPICYYKLLQKSYIEIQRLQQELDIKEKMLDKFMIGSGETLEKLQQENEKLKEQLNIYMSQYEIKIPNKYRQTLEEIREIAKYSIMHNCELNSNYQIILQKIDEALNDRD